MEISELGLNHVLWNIEWWKLTSGLGLNHHVLWNIEKFELIIGLGLLYMSSPSFSSVANGTSSIIEDLVLHLIPCILLLVIGCQICPTYLV